MQNLIRNYTVKTCVTALTLLMFSQVVSANSTNTKMSYLDSVSGSYLYNKQNNSQILDSNSSDAAGIEASFKLDSKPTITKSHDKVKLSLRDSDIKQVLRMLADRAKVNIVLDKSIEGNITLDLNDIDINDAFLVIFKAMQYTYIMENNTLTVMTLDAYKDLGYTRQNMTVLPIKYVNADNVANFLNDNLFSSKIFGLSNHPIVTSNPGTNQIIVFGSNADVIAIKRILPILDTKPQVNNFKVNHTTPKEMANLVCDSLFFDSGSEGTRKSSENTDLSADEIMLGGGIVACRDTAKDSNSNSSEGLSAFKTNPLTITYFPELGRISAIGGSVEQVKVIEDFIKVHDKKQLMAYIELSVIELNESGSKEFTNTWNLWTPFIALGFDPGSGLTTSSTTPFFLWGNKYPEVLRKTDINGKITSTDSYVMKTNNKALVYQLKYLVENGNGRVLTNPKIMVTNGRKATIDMTSDYVKSVTSQVLTDTLAGATQKTYDIGSDEGLKIEIVPFISPEGYVSMNIAPEFATIKERVTAVGEDGKTNEIQATLLQRRDLELKNIRIRDGETLVLAGLIKESEQQTIQKMPLLSDLPFIGAFFRGNMNTKAREELVIVVTPHIVKDNDSQSSSVYDL